MLTPDELIEIIVRVAKWFAEGILLWLVILVLLSFYVGARYE